VHDDTQKQLNSQEFKHWEAEERQRAAAELAQMETEAQLAAELAEVWCRMLQTSVLLMRLTNWLRNRRLSPVTLCTSVTLWQAETKAQEEATLLERELQRQKEELQALDKQVEAEQQKQDDTRHNIQATTVASVDKLRAIAEIRGTKTMSVR
jgi:hypothetical protein